MVSKIRLGYEGKFYDAFDITIHNDRTNSETTLRVADKRLDEALFGPDGDYVDNMAQNLDEEIFYFLSEDEMKKSCEDLECMVYCMWNEVKYIGDCQCQTSDGTIHKYQSYNPY